MAGNHYSDCDGCVNKLVLSYGENLHSAPYHKLFSDTCKQPAMECGERACGPWLGMLVMLSGRVKGFLRVFSFRNIRTKHCFKGLDRGEQRSFFFFQALKPKRVNVNKVNLRPACSKQTGLSSSHIHFYENATSPCLLPPPSKFLLPHKHYKCLLLRSWKHSY